jgi:hypothetical protein
MPVLTITISEDPIQIISGIPRSISVETNLPSTVFYTLDGSDPTVDSDILIGSLTLPTNYPSILLKLFATNGVDDSGIIEIEYKTSWIGDKRPRDKVISDDSGCSSGCVEPFTSSYTGPTAQYGNMAGVVVDSAGAEGIPNGYRDGYVVSETDKPYHRWNYDIVYDTTNSIGLSGPFIGNLPAKVTYYKPPTYNKSNKVNSLLFNPKAMVIVQDGRQENEDPNVTFLNRNYFSLKPSRDDFSDYTTPANDGNPLKGSFIKSFYNQKENTYTFYYRDFATDRWIISIEPASKIKTNPKPVLKDFIAPVSFANKKVFQWVPFHRRYI